MSVQNMSHYGIGGQMARDGRPLTPYRQAFANPTGPDDVPDLLDMVDPGIRESVRILREHGIETTESCEGTRGHSYPEPTVCFTGTQAVGLKALAIALEYGLCPARLERVYSVENGEIMSTDWRLIFRHPGGGGLQCVERPDGGHVWEWGPVPQPPTPGYSTCPRG